jgi:ankyrin repeat protein
LDFARIKTSGNDSEPIYAAGQERLLLEAAARDDLKAVETLLREEANPNAGDARGVRPLSHAARNGAVEMARMLLEAGADPDAKSDDGFTPLTLAALNGHAQIAALLLEAGARVDLRSNNGLTPLMNAALMNRAATVKIILRHDEVDRINPAGRTALSYAAEGGAEEVMEILIGQGADLHLRDRRANPPLFWAAVGNHRGAIRLLVKHGAETGGIAFDPL